MATRGALPSGARRDWTSAPFRRQRFRCVPDDGSDPHTFSLGRRRQSDAHGADVECLTCDVKPGVAQGPISPPDHLHTAVEIAHLLQLIAEGMSLRRASRTIRLEAHRYVEDAHGMPPREPPAHPRRPLPRPVRHRDRQGSRADEVPEDPDPRLQAAQPAGIRRGRLRPDLEPRGAGRSGADRGRRRRLQAADDAVADRPRPRRDRSLVDRLPRRDRPDRRRPRVGGRGRRGRDRRRGRAAMAQRQLLLVRVPPGPTHQGARPCATARQVARLSCVDIPRRPPISSCVKPSQSSRATPPAVRDPAAPPRVWPSPRRGQSRQTMSSGP
jgi:hypothetical protein